MTKFAEDIIIWHMCNKNHNHLMYGSWDIKWDRQNFLSFWAIFCLFTPSLPHQGFRKSKFWKQMKKNKSLKILSFYTYMCIINEDRMIYGSWNVRSNRLNFLSFWVIFCPFSSLTTWKFKIFKLKKTLGDIILHICTINDSHMMYGSSDIERDRQNFLSFWTVFCPFTSL